MDIVHCFLSLFQKKIVMFDLFDLFKNFNSLCDVLYGPPSFVEERRSQTEKIQFEFECFQKSPHFLCTFWLWRKYQKNKSNQEMKKRYQKWKEKEMKQRERCTRQSKWVRCLKMLSKSSLRETRNSLSVMFIRRGERISSNCFVNSLIRDSTK